MKKSSLIIWVIIFGLIAMVFYQNSAFFFETRKSLSFNLGAIAPLQTPELQIWVYFVIFFFLGIVIAYIFTFPTRFKAKRTIKKLNAKLSLQDNEVTELKSEINSLKGIEEPAAEQPLEPKIDTAATQKMTKESVVETPAEKKGKFSFHKKEANPTKDPQDKSREKTQ